MAIAYRNGATGGNGTGTDVTVTKPSGVVDGDILLATTYREGGTWTLPSGWAWVNTGTPEQVNTAGNAWIGLAWKRASSEGASYVFQLSTTTWRIVTIGAWSGALESGNPIDVYASGANGASLSIVADSITTTVADTMCIVGTGNYDGSDVSAASSGYTQRAELGGCEFFEFAKAAAGATGTATFTRSSGVAGTTANWHIALKPATGGGATAIEFVASTMNSATAVTTSCVLTKPTGAVAGDLLIAALNIENNNPTVTPPSGWTLIYSATPTGTARAIRQRTYCKLLTSDDDGTSSFTWTVTTGYEWAGIMACYRNAQVPTVSAASTTNSSSVNAVAPTVSTTGDGAWAIIVASSAYGTTWTPPSGYTERADRRSSTGTSNVSIALADKLYATAGATGTQTYVAVNADYWTAGHIVLEVVAGASTWNLTATAAGASATGNAALNIARPFTANAAGASTTANALLGNILSFTAASAGASSTITGALNVARALTSASIGATSTSTGALNVARSLAANGAGASATSAPILAVARPFIAASAGASATANAALNLTCNIAATFAGASLTGDANLSISGFVSLAAACAGASATQVAALAVARAITAAAAGATSTQNALLGLQYTFTAQAGATTNTPAAALSVARSVTAQAAGASNVANANLSIAGLIALAAAMAGATDTPAAQLAIARALSASAPGVTLTGDATLLARVDFAAQAAGESSTGDAALNVWREVAAQCAGATDVPDANLFAAAVLYLQAQFGAATLVANATLRNQIVTGLMVATAAAWASGLTATGVGPVMTATGRNVAPTATGRAAGMIATGASPSISGTGER